MYKTKPPSQCGPEIKYIFQGGIFGKESLLAMPSRSLGVSIVWRSLSWAYLTCGHVSFYIVLVWDARDVSYICGGIWAMPISFIIGAIMWMTATNLWVPGSRRCSYHPYRVSRASKTLSQPRTRVPLMVNCLTVPYAILSIFCHRSDIKNWFRTQHQTKISDHKIPSVSYL